MHLSRTTKRAYLAMAACVLVAILVDAACHLGPLIVRDLLEASHIYTFVAYACFLVIWLRLVRQRSLSGEALACMHAAGVVMLVWLLVRTIKYEFIYGLPRMANRYLWYAFYLGYTFVPATLFLAVMHVGKRAGERIARPWWLVLAGAAAISALVLTNDFHQLAFRFGESFDFWETDDMSPFARGPLFYVAFAWLAALAIAGIGVALVRCRRQTSRAALVVPLAVLCLGLLYTVLYAGVPHFSDYFPIRTTEFTCGMTVVFMECLVALGLFPSNELYGELWQASSLSGALMDGQGRVVDAAKGAPEVDAAQVKLAESGPLVLDGDLVLVARHVQGGTAYWVRDLSRMHALQAQLEELGDTLAEENAMLEAENELVHEREAVRQREALYDKVFACTAGELDSLAKRLESLPADEDAFVRAMNRAAVTAACIKRHANLVLVGEPGTIDLRELSLAVEEVALWLRACGATVSVIARDAGSLATDEALQAFERFCDWVEGMPDDMSQLTLTCDLGAFVPGGESA